MHSLGGKDNSLIILRAIENIEDFDLISDDPVENDVIAMRGAAHAAALVTWHQGNAKAM